MRKFYRVINGKAVQVKGPTNVHPPFVHRPVCVVPSMYFRDPAQRPMLAAIPF